MKSFIFRNSTIEALFGTKEVGYSGYEDISFVPEADRYIWFYQVPIKFDSATLSAEIDEYASKLKILYSQIPAHKTFIVFTLENLFALEYSDSDFAVRKSILAFNDFIYQFASEHKNVKVVDFSDFSNKYTKDQLIDWKFYFISQTQINPRLATDFKKWFDAKIKSIELKRKKCLVLDLDNTLWKGILGEDGIDGIKIGGDYPGKAFLYFQEALLELSKSGVILTICSKNNEEEVLNCWEKNPFNLIKKEHIASYRINWNDKATNIKEIAQELNIGLDSLVFIDDNPTERELIKQVLPMVEVPEFPDQPYKLMGFFKQILDSYFKVYELTSEDKNKTEQYKANSQRAQAQSQFADFTDYLRSLEIKVTVESANSFNVPRIAQMTQKTNQFNLTTRRYTEADVEQMLKDGALIYCADISDKFGNNGITGAIILKPIANGSYFIDSLLLSCRVLGKGIENAFVKAILNKVLESGVTEIKAEYIPTKKSAQVANFYDKLGFSLQEENEDGHKSYSMQLSNNQSIEDYYAINFK